MVQMNESILIDRYFITQKKRDCPRE